MLRIADGVNASKNLLDILDENNKVVKKSENIESKDFIFNLGEDGDKIKYTNRPIDPGELSIESILENNKKLGEKRTLVDISAKYNYKFNDFKLKLENEISKLIEIFHPKHGEITLVQ